MNVSGALLDEKIRRHIESIKENGSVADHLDLRGLRLEGADFVSWELYEINFSGSEIERTNFMGAQMGGAIMDRCRVSESSFKQTVICEASASHSEFVDCSFVRTDLDGAVFRDVKFVGCNFTKTLIMGATLERVRFVDCVMNRLDFGETSLEGLVIERPKGVGGIVINSTPLAQSSDARAALLHELSA